MNSRVIFLHAILLLCGISMVLSGCKGLQTELPLVAGVLDAPLPADSVPARVLEAIAKAERFHQHEIMSDTQANVSVFSLDEVDNTSTEGFGIVVVKGAVSTTFPHIRNVREPQARYDSNSKTLWLTASAMEGTGVAVERLYGIRFHANDSAYIVPAAEQPYDLQQLLCKRLRYSIDGQRVTLFDGRDSIAAATNSVDEMGGFDSEHPLWIGEQMLFDLSGESPSLLVTPGVRFTGGPMLAYDDMPMLSAPLSIGKNGIEGIGELSLVSHPFVGDYLDEDNNEPNLHITYRRSDGRYNVEIGIFRLTLLDDGIGTISGDELRFIATDAAGNPIGGSISMKGDTAVVKFTDSHWDLLPNGSEFRYTREK